jgi:drug/metabolite transporter (DMT)-like permease
MAGDVKPIRSLPLKNSTFKNAIFFVIVVCGDTIGNLLLALGMGRMPDLGVTPFWHYLASLLVNFRLLGGTALLATAMLSRLSLYTWADLTYVLPVTASGYVITAFLSKFVLHEYISDRRWIGVVLISLAVCGKSN